MRTRDGGGKGAKNTPLTCSDVMLTPLNLESSHTRKAEQTGQHTGNRQIRARRVDRRHTFTFVIDFTSYRAICVYKNLTGVVHCIAVDHDRTCCRTCHSRYQSRRKSKYEQRLVFILIFSTLSFTYPARVVRYTKAREIEVEH